MAKRLRKEVEPTNAENTDLISEHPPNVGTRGKDCGDNQSEKSGCSSSKEEGEVVSSDEELSSLSDSTEKETG